MRYCITVLLLAISLLAFAGGPWLVPKKSGFFQVQSTFPAAGYTKLFLENNQNLTLKREVLDYTFQAYLEYGISNKFNLIATLPVKFISTGNVVMGFVDSTLLDKGSLIGLSNCKIALKYGITKKKILTAVSIQSSFNTTSKQLKNGLVTGYLTNSVGIYGHIGKGFSSKLYSFFEAGFNATNNGFSNYVEVHYELGYSFKPQSWIAFTIDVRESLKNGDYLNENLRQTGLYTNNQEYFAYGVKGSYELKNKLGFTMATFGAFSGNYVAKISTFSVGVYKKW